MKYYEGYKYQLAEDTWFLTNIYPPENIIQDFWEIYTNGLVCGRRGYAWDGSSGALDTKKTQAPSCVHDIICQSIQIGVLDKKWKDIGDLEYYHLCKRNGVWPVVSEIRYIAIHFHDWENTQPKGLVEVPNVQPVYIKPLIEVANAHRRAVQTAT